MCSTRCSGPALRFCMRQNRHLKHNEGKAICQSLSREENTSGILIEDAHREMRPAYIQSRQFPLRSRGYLSSEPSESSLVPYADSVLPFASRTFFCRGV
jgi:hypothetical protein